MLNLAKRAAGLLFVSSMSSDSFFVRGITEDEDAVTLRDGAASQERPRLEGYDMDESVQEQIE